MATPIIMPRQGQSVESCLLVEWKVKPGDQVAAGQALASIETDKAVFELESPAAGAVLELFFPVGSDIPVLTNVGAVGSPGEDVSGFRPGGAAGPAAAATPAAAAVAPAAPAASAPAAMATAAAAAEAVGISPRARKLAEATGVSAAALAGSGPGGRVIERDVQAAAAAGPRLTPAAREAVSAGAARPAAGTGPGGLATLADLKAAPATAPTVAAATAAPKTVPMSGIRKIIAERMFKSLTTTAQLTLNRSFDATAIQTFRQKAKEHGEDFGLPKLTINDLIAYATVRTLTRHPAMNAHFLGDRVVQHASVNLGVAMDTPRGLMVPVVAGAERLSLVELAARIKPLVDAAQKGSVNPDLLSGGTFTITNMGMLGIESFTPILNAPEVGILGVGGISLKPVAGEGGVKFVQAIGLSLTLDHQAVDGGDGARFLKDLAEALENFELLLAKK